MAASPFLNRIRRELRLGGYSLRTEKTYLHWIKRFIRFHQLRHPADMGASEVRRFLTWLAADCHVAVNTQKTALNALAFMYHKVLNIELGELDFHRATQYRRLPVVLTQAEVALIFKHLDERNRLIFSSILRGKPRPFRAGRDSTAASAAPVPASPFKLAIYTVVY
ncbi:phage integrase N-terminal SAM-like domain-containing protein [Oceanimonas smirnovii]|uniref:phage integrase N-terminal SAM-like domain-containing protein n=1 Tax=Oceanimonas TaxID=129577 RepID=UPI001D194342|nr:phage integrase N-terminal SAM-like domain-containing protein [Oceanimonas baumannii]MCC4264715.1 phage integrase N-terminal SAM-like domain-containing protein [Oceanimonas baumannii]